MGAPWGLGAPGPLDKTALLLNTAVMPVIWRQRNMFEKKTNFTSPMWHRKSGSSSVDQSQIFCTDRYMKCSRPTTILLLKQHYRSSSRPKECYNLKNKLVLKAINDVAVSVGSHVGPIPLCKMSFDPDHPLNISSATD